MNYKLLVAGDGPNERAALRRTLSGYFGQSLTVLDAADGNEALAVFHRESPNIAILNIEMPALNGLEVAQKIRESGHVCALLFISDHDNFSYAKQAIALRALDFLLKPIDENKLILSVQEAMQYAAQIASFVRERPAPHHFDSAEKPEEDTEGARITLVREDISSFIDAHYMEELSMKNAAHALNYSDAYFCKLFKQCFHVNFSTYLNEYRIEKAKAMMENPRINIKSISLACGYTDSNYFSRVFKRITGQTPTEYRFAIMEKNLRN